MKFSMELLKHHLQKYEPVATINSTEPTILGVKLFSYEREPDPDFLYVGHNNNFFYGSDSHEVLLVHRTDVMSLSTSELEDVFNEIMECFSFYAEWEQRLLSSYNKPNPEQAIIDACKGIFEPMFFTTMSLQITAISDNYPKGSVNRNWDDFLETGTLSIERFSNLKDGMYLNSHNSIWDGNVFYEKSVERYQHSIMISQVSLNGKLTGQMTIISETPFEEYQLHLLPPIKTALCLVANMVSDGDRGSVAQSVFLDLVEGNRKESTIRKFYDLMGWGAETLCGVGILKNRNATRVSFGYDMDILRKEFSNALFCVNEGSLSKNEIICCLPTGQSADMEQLDRFFKFTKNMGFECGVSYPRAGAENLEVLYYQAQAALEYKAGHFYYCAMYELVGMNGSAEYRKAALHPAIEKILAYDAQKKTDFYQMLETYLHNERDRVRTAEELYVHKNTLVYRLKKAEELFDVQLDDIYDREYLLISLIFMKNLL